MNHEYLTRAVTSLFRMRNETTRSVERLSERLDADIEAGSKNAGTASTEDSPERNANSPRRLDIVRKNWALARRLRMAVRSHSTSQIVCVSLKRLPLQLNADVFQSIETLTLSSSGVPLVGVCEGLTVILDPANVIETHTDALPPNVVLATPVSIILAALPRMLLSLGGEFWPLLRTVHAGVSNATLPAKISICLCVVAMNIVFRAHRDIEYTLTTSNSVLLEATRFWAMQSHQVSFTREIMHGIPVPVMDQYFDEISSTALHPIELVPQVPLPSWRPTGAARSSGNIFCNLATNKMFLRALGPHTTWTLNRMADYVNQATEAATSFGQTAVFFGGNHSGEPFFQSKHFILEKIMMRQIRATLDKAAPNARLVYLPHPSHGPVTPTIATEIQQFVHDIDYRSQPWYFVAEFASGLFSSALLELAALGAKVFSPVTPADGIYHPQMMAELLWTPTEPGLCGIEKGLTDAISDICTSVRVKDATRDRLSLLYPTYE